MKHPARHALALPLLLTLAACGGEDDSSDQEATYEELLPDRAEKLDALPSIDGRLGYQLDEGAFDVDPGADVTYCVRIPVPEEWVGRDVGLIGWDWDLPVNTHHFFMAYSEREVDFGGAPFIPCDGKDPIVDNSTVLGLEEAFGGGGAVTAGEGLSRTGEGKLVFGAGVGVGRYLGDPGYGRILKAGGHLVTNHHVLNMSPDVVTMTGRFNMYLRAPEDLPHRTHELNCLTLDVNMEPRSKRTVTSTCTAPHDLDITLLASHGHNHLKRFETRLYDGQRGETLPDPLYVSEDWDSPLLAYQEKPLRLRKGDGLTYTCHYENDTDDAVTFGTNVANEMCATMNAYALPPERAFEDAPPLGAVALKNESPSCITFDLETNQPIPLLDADGKPSCDLQDTTKSPIPFF